jgi:hypothetical protein
MVAHTCNPSDSGGRDQEDRSSKPNRENNLRDPISKTPITKKKKKAGRVAQSVGLSSTPSTTKKGGDIIVIQKKKVLLFFVQVILWSYRQY